MDTTPVSLAEFKAFIDKVISNKKTASIYKSSLSRLNKIGVTDVCTVYSDPIVIATRLYDAKVDRHACYIMFKSLKHILGFILKDDVFVQRFPDIKADLFKDFKKFIIDPVYNNRQKFGTIVIDDEPPEHDDATDLDQSDMVDIDATGYVPAYAMNTSYIHEAIGQLQHDFQHLLLSNNAYLDKIERRADESYAIQDASIKDVANRLEYVEKNVDFIQSNVCAIHARLDYLSHIVGTLMTSNAIEPEKKNELLTFMFNRGVAPPHDAFM